MTTVPVGRLCEVSGCRKMSVSHGLCDMHRKRKERHGHILETRPHDWGAREKHSLYESWIWLCRRRHGEICDLWRKDFWSFVAYVGERPSPSHVLFRESVIDPYGPGNCSWVERRKSGKSDDQKKDRATYMREWRERNRERVIAQSTERRYGLSFDDHSKMILSQNNVCAICDKPETSVDNRTKMVRRLAVDHCHSSGRVRELLCSKCNKALGSVGDSVEILQKMILYIQKHSPDMES